MAGPLEGDQVKTLTVEAACYLGKQSDGLVPDLFEGLVKGSRPLLYEVCCAPSSVLSEVAVQLGHQSEAVRCAEWNGGDLSRPEGQSVALQRLRLNNPRHV